MSKGTPEEFDPVVVLLTDIKSRVSQLSDKTTEIERGQGESKMGLTALADSATRLEKRLDSQTLEMKAEQKELS